MEFIANNYLSEKEQSGKDNRMVEKFVNDMSTVCFNLLSNLHVKRRQHTNHSSEVIKPGWLPDIEIKTVNEPVSNIETEHKAKGKQKNTNIPVRVVQPMQTKQSVNQKSVEIKKNMVVKQTNKKSRKQLIINNQGSPLTIQFGHERR